MSKLTHETSTLLQKIYRDLQLLHGEELPPTVYLQYDRTCWFVNVNLERAWKGLLDADYSPRSPSHNLAIRDLFLSGESVRHFGSVCHLYPSIAGLTPAQDARWRLYAEVYRDIYLGIPPSPEASVPYAAIRISMVCGSKCSWNTWLRERPRDYEWYASLLTLTRLKPDMGLELRKTYPESHFFVDEEKLINHELLTNTFMMVFPSHSHDTQTVLVTPKGLFLQP